MHQQQLLHNIQSGTETIGKNLLLIAWDSALRGGGGGGGGVDFIFIQNKVNK